jgi:hypothetical protein
VLFYVYWCAVVEETFNMAIESYWRWEYERVVREFDLA